MHVPITLPSSMLCRKRNERNPDSVGAFGDRLHPPDRAFLPQGHRHRALVVPHRQAVGPEQLPGAAPFGAAQHRAATPEIDRRLIVVGDLSVLVRGVDGGRKGFEKLVKTPFTLAQRLETAPAPPGARIGLELGPCADDLLLDGSGLGFDDAQAWLVHEILDLSVTYE